MTKIDSMYRSLFQELDELEQRGVSIQVNQTRMSPCQVADIFAVRETSEYMRDYVMEGGVLCELHFDEISDGPYAF